MSGTDLFVGITSWESALFLGHNLREMRRTTAEVDTRIVVLDNGSADESAEIARSFGAEVIVRRCSQPDALNHLLSLSRSPYTLLAHSDVVMLSPRWFELCRARLTGNVALVSPEDIGCGPYTRPFGRGQPESSFMFFDTAMARRTRITRWEKRARLPWPRRVVDFYGDHVTHNLPRRLRESGMAWAPMSVLMSPASQDPVYIPPFRPDVWSDELAHLQYGLGNFYSIGGEITHYHNWYDRIAKNVDASSTETTQPGGRGFPAAFVARYTANFLRDLDAGELQLPDVRAPAREPRAL